MSTLSVKTILVQDNCLICITTSGNTLTLTDPDKVQYLLTTALPFFSKTPNSILEVDLDDIKQTRIIDSFGNVITYCADTLTSSKGTYNVNLKPMAAFTAYAEEHNYSISAFMEKVANMLDNGRTAAVEDIMSFMVKNELPITQAGNILAFKVLWHNPTNDTCCDCYSRTIYQGVGDIVSMDSTQVTKDRDLHCAAGLHVCSLEYACIFMTENCKIALVQVDPRTVCSVPNDSKSKMRVSRYQILGFVKDTEISPLLQGNYSEVPQFKKLLDRAISCVFKGAERYIRLLVPTVSSATQMKISHLHTFLMEPKEKEAEAPLVEKKPKKEETTLNEVIIYLGTFKTTPAHFKAAYGENKKFLKKLKELKTKFTWEELGAERKLQRYLLKQFKKYGL